MKHSVKESEVLRSPRKKIVFLIFSLLVIFVLVIFIILVQQPERSVASFCRVAKEQKSILTGDVSYEQRLDAYKKLEAVSPDEIQPDITTIRKGYETIIQDPSKALSAGFGMSGAENRRTDFINQNCTDF